MIDCAEIKCIGCYYFYVIIGVVFFPYKHCSTIKIEYYNLTKTIFII